MDLIKCPNLCINGKIKYFPDSKIAIFDLANCPFCNGKGVVTKEKELKIIKLL